MKEPFRSIPEGEGFGFYGKPEIHPHGLDLVMCHQCGTWKKRIHGNHLASPKCQVHVKNPVHNLRDYNEKYGYPLRFHHVARSFSNAMRSHMEDRIRRGDFPLAGCGKSPQKGIPRPQSEYAWNQADQCDLQLKRALDERIEELGRIPREQEFCPTGAVSKRYGSYNKFLAKMGIANRPPRHSYSDEELLKFLSEFFNQHDRLPMCSDFKAGRIGPESKPLNIGLYWARFGGLIPARLKAGLPPV